MTDPVIEAYREALRFYAYEAFDPTHAAHNRASGMTFTKAALDQGDIARQALKHDPATGSSGRGA